MPDVDFTLPPHYALDNACWLLGPAHCNAGSSPPSQRPCCIFSHKGGFEKFLSFLILLWRKKMCHQNIPCTVPQAVHSCCSAPFKNYRKHLINIWSFWTWCFMPKKLNLHIDAQLQLISGIRQLPVNTDKRFTSSSIMTLPLIHIFIFCVLFN